MFLIIFLVVKSYYSFDIKFLKYFYVLIGVMTVSLICITFFDGTHEGHKFARYDPIDVAVFHAFKVLIFFDMECLEIVPLKVDSMLESLETLQ